MRATLRKHGLAALIVWPVALMLGGALWLRIGPMLESRLAPVLTEQAVDDVTRVVDRVCWRWRYVKVRYGTPEAFAFSYIVGGRAVRNAVPIRESDGKPISRHQVRPPGPGDIRLCVDLPDDIELVPGVAIAGAVEYETSHHLWTIWQDVPAVPVPDPPP